MNDNKALWLRDKSEIEHDEYVSFYKALTKDYDEPMNWIHFKAEGDLVFTSLLYIPKRVAHD
jgi:heat shock protein beta